jgi:hypothetical protein
LPKGLRHAFRETRRYSVVVVTGSVTHEANEETLPAHEARAKAMEQAQSALK